MRSTLLLETTAYTLDQIVSLPQAQVAFAGRSNVGKSSLVNALAGRKTLAKTSATPGKTRSLNFYHVEPDDFYIVDLPGYGYARCSQKEREAWGRLMERYLTTAMGLKALVLLLDCRLPPQKLDIHLATFAQEHRIPLLPILTKADKCSRRERAERQRDWQHLLGGILPLVTSARSRQGLDDVWGALRIAAGSAPMNTEES
ncbi:MAG: ribosome biogenesis GTP-binding protein YihA/YsxC [Desulfovibrionaceae bacterium]|nr:ribosome biogenesis GTP-binding protein YihA/YsxC [Desulfovibrionaceae bacterium]